jgi:tetratricopeptide (TPR) repeat protein
MRSIFFLYSIVVLVAPYLGAQNASAAATPAERRINAARAAIAKNPTYADAHADLALALAMRARETSDTVFYEQGLKAVERALEIDKSSFAALKAQTWILLGQHEFARALTIATALRQRSGDDVMVYGFLSDANTELGNYKAAEEATQWMLDLRPGNIPALTRAAHLRELFGDPEGAIELFQMAHQQLADSETENRAWLLVQLSHLSLMQGRIEDADRMAGQALGVFPGYHYALGQLAKVRRAQKRYDEAVKLERQRFVAAPHPENQFTLAQTLELAGQTTEARTTFTEFERRARAEMNGPDNANHELIFYYADHARKPQEALKVAQTEIARRQDVHTLHAYAWALHKSGNHAEARRQMDRALSVGIRDPEFYRHASRIALALNDRRAAKSFEQKAAELMPDSRRVAYAGGGDARVR